MKNTYCFALGTNHSLCKAEILNVLVQKQIKAEILAASSEVLIIQTDSEIDPKTLINELGSSAKIIEIIDLLPHQDFLSNFRNKFQNKDYQNFFLPKDEKYVLIGLSAYSGGGNFKSLNNLWYLAPKIIKEIRFILSSAAKSSGFIPLKERVLSTVSVDKNELFKKGFEIVFCSAKDGIYVGKTTAVQDYESYSFRDYQRPKKDSKSGMIPLKLARIMINFAGKDKEDKLVDPFCGSGTILQEMIMLGFSDIAGTDIQPKAINDTQANLDWLFNNYPSLKKDEYQISLKISGIKKFSQTVGENTVDGIITEPVLGSSRAKTFNLIEIKDELNNLKNLYLDAFSEFKKVLKKEGIVVIVLPVFRYQNQSLFLDVLNDIKKIGFATKDFIPKEFEKYKQKLNLELTPRNSIVYYRPDQAIIREIIIFQRL